MPRRTSDDAEAARPPIVGENRGDVAAKLRRMSKHSRIIWKRHARPVAANPVGVLRKVRGRITDRERVHPHQRGGVGIIVRVVDASRSMDSFDKVASVLLAWDSQRSSLLGFALSMSVQIADRSRFFRNGRSRRLRDSHLPDANVSTPRYRSRRVTAC